MLTYKWGRVKLILWFPFDCPNQVSAGDYSSTDYLSWFWWEIQSIITCKYWKEVMMNKFYAVLSLLSAMVLTIILFTSDYKRSDKTWKSFSAMVLFYIIYDLILFVGSLTSNKLVAQFTNFTAVCCAILALFEFHFYLICFFRISINFNY